MWYEVVRDYTQKALIYDSDELAAIAGLANVFEEQGWGKEYIAGLWKEDVLRGLLWERRNDNVYEIDEQFARHFPNARFPS